MKHFPFVLLLLVPAAAVARGPGVVGAGAPDRSIAGEIDRWSPHIAEASTRFNIPENWIRRVMRAESGGQTTRHGWPITSRAGAMGLMQLMPGTWAEMRLAHGLGPDPHDPRDNILAGTAYLRAMYDRFGYPGLFAAYNAGPTRYAEHLANGRRLPPETVAYVAAAGLTAPSAARPPNDPRKADIFIWLVGPPHRDAEPPGARVVSSLLFIRLNAVSAASE